MNSDILRSRASARIFACVKANMLRWSSSGRLIMRRQSPCILCKKGAVLEALPEWIQCVLAAATIERWMQSQAHAYNISSSEYANQGTCFSKGTFVTTESVSLRLHRMLQHSLLDLFDVRSTALSLLALKAAHC